MIIKGGSRRAGRFFARHLMRADENERVSITEIRGLVALNVRDALREMEAVASGTRCLNYFYHVDLNPRESEVLTPEQWRRAIDTLERTLGLTDQPRFVVEHEKGGRTHRHVVWSRIDIDSMTTISDSLTYRKHECAAREIEQLFGHEPVKSVLVKDRKTLRPERNPQDWESFRGQESKCDPKAIKAEVTALWFAADSGTAFAAALREHGYILVRGDRRDFCLIDVAGDEHSLARRITGVKATEIRARLADIDRDALPSVAEGRELARQHQDTEGDTVDPAPTDNEHRDSQKPERDEPSGEAAATPPAPAPKAVPDLAPAVPNVTLTPKTEPTTLSGMVAQWGRRTVASLFGRAASPEQDTGPASTAVEPSPPAAEIASNSAPNMLAPLEPDGPAAPAVLTLNSRQENASAAVLAMTMADAEEAVGTSLDPIVRPLEQPSPAGNSAAFKAVENETISQAIADQAATDAEDSSGRGGRFARVRGWWDNMREYVAGWRDTMKERASHYLAQWEREEMRERDAEYSPAPVPEHAPQLSGGPTYQPTPERTQGPAYEVPPEPSPEPKPRAPNPGMDMTP